MATIFQGFRIKGIDEKRVPDPKDAGTYRVGSDGINFQRYTVYLILEPIKDSDTSPIRKMTRAKNFTLSVLLPLLLVFLIGCTESTETPTETSQLLPETPSLTVPEIAEIALDSTVYLQVKKPENKMGSASGFVIGDGLIVTSYHVIEDMLTGSTARLVNSDPIHPIELIVVADKAHDLVILKSSGISAPTLLLGDSDAVRIGDTAYVAGNPKGFLGTFSVGYISAIQLSDPLVADKVLQMTAPISRGSSGGPVLNDRGEVIGIVSSIEDAGQLLNFATPVNFLKSLLATIH